MIDIGKQQWAQGGSDPWAEGKVKTLVGAMGGGGDPETSFSDVSSVIGDNVSIAVLHIPTGKEPKKDEIGGITMPAEVTKDLLDARLETVEVRMDARMVAIDAKFDALQKALQQQSDDFRSFKTDVQAGLADFKKEVHQDNKSTRATIITTGVAAVLSIVLGVAAFNATVLSNMVASFESGRNTAQALNDAASKLEKAQASKDEVKPKDPAPPAKP